MEDEECCHGFCAKLPCLQTSVLCYQVKKKSDRPVVALTILAIICLLMGIIAPVVLDVLLNDGINDSVVIDSTSATSYQTWVQNNAGTDDDVPISYELYIFDVTNADEAALGEKPIIVERGPYYYQEYFEHFNVEFHKV